MQAFFMSRDGRYVAGAWTRRSGAPDGNECAHNTRYDAIRLSKLTIGSDLIRHNRSKFRVDE